MKKLTRLFLIVIILCLSLPTLAAGNLPTDGEYTVEGSLTGGSGRAGIESPLTLHVKDGVVTAHLVWSSRNFSWMAIDGQRYDAVIENGVSTFDVPVRLDEDLPFQAETVAMSTPHVIDYVLHLDSATLSAAAEQNRKENRSESKNEKAEEHRPQRPENCDLGNGWKKLSFLKTEYAEHFGVDYYQDGYKLIWISDGSLFLLVPEGQERPEGLRPEITVLKQPLKNLYLCASSIMDQFVALDGLDSLLFSGFKADHWADEAPRKAMEDGKIVFAGKYKSPDYELLMAGGCTLAIENGMLTHAPEVKEKLQEIGIPVLVEQSSYESHPLGRSEWIRLIGALLDKEEKAGALFEQQVELMKKSSQTKKSGKTVAFFYVASNGSAVARKSGDYVSKMIELAGGRYVFEHLGDSSHAGSTVSISMEDFYATAKDADFVVYNSTITGEIHSLEDFIQLNPLLADLKAVKNHNVWCTSQNLYQATTQHGQMISEFSQMLQSDGAETAPKLKYLFRLED